MIDRSVLVDLLATKIGREQAERDVAACIEEFDITTVQVPPGQVFFHYTAQTDDLASFLCEGPLEVNGDAVDQPYVVISSEPLTWGQWRCHVTRCIGQSQATKTPPLRPRLARSRGCLSYDANRHQALSPLLIRRATSTVSVVHSVAPQFSPLPSKRLATAP